MAVQGQCLLLILNHFDAAVVELLQGDSEVDLDVSGGPALRGLCSSERRAEHATLDLKPSAVEDPMKRIALKEELVKDIIAILLIDVPANIL